MSPRVRRNGAAASPPMLRLMAWALGAGAVLLFPSVVLLFRIFKKDALSGRHGRGA